MLGILIQTPKLCLWELLELVTCTQDLLFRLINESTSVVKIYLDIVLSIQQQYRETANFDTVSITIVILNWKNLYWTSCCYIPYVVKLKMLALITKYFFCVIVKQKVFQTNHLNQFVNEHQWVHRCFTHIRLVAKVSIWWWISGSLSPLRCEC